MVLRETGARTRGALSVQWLLIAAAGAGGLAIAAGVVPAVTTAEDGFGRWRFVAGALAAWAITMARFWRHRHDRDPAGSPAGRVTADAKAPSAAPAPLAWNGLGMANAITLARAWLIAVVAGHLLLPATHGMAAVCVGVVYTVAAILDGVDGYVARGRAYVTALGSRLDVSTDALGLLVAPIVAIHANRLPPWYLLLAVAYPAMRAAMALRAHWGLPVFPQRLRPNPQARLFAGVQMGVVAAALFPILPVGLLWTAATVAMVPTLRLFAQEWRLVTTTSAVLDRRVETA